MLYVHFLQTTFLYIPLHTQQQDMDSSTPLILAATHGFTDVVNLLASAGCDLDQRNSEGDICFSIELTLPRFTLCSLHW